MKKNFFNFFVVLFFAFFVGTAAAQSGNDDADYPFDVSAYNFEEVYGVSKEIPDDDMIIAPSRSMTLKNEQFVDITYPGTGWIYLGEEKTANFDFLRRILVNGKSVFVLCSRNSGKSLLHFYKKDGLANKYIDDYIEINVTDEIAKDSVHIAAPAYAEVVPPKYEMGKNSSIKNRNSSKPPIKEKKYDLNSDVVIASNDSSKSVSKTPSLKEDLENSEKIQTVIQAFETKKTDESKRTSVANPMDSEREFANPKTQVSFDAETLESTSPKSFLEEAQKAYDEKRYADALNFMQMFFNVATKDFDAGLYLEGRILEARSDVRNIKAAIDAYETLVQNWPQSNYWQRAKERGIYLKRFYIDIK